MSGSDKSLGMGDIAFRPAAKRASVRPGAELASENVLDLPQDVSDREPTGKADGIRALRRVSRAKAGIASFTVVLEEPLKERLERASYEHRVKMTAIVRAAVEQYLKENGY